MTEDSTRIGFIGAGNMAQAIGLRLISEGMVKPSQITVSAPSDRNLVLWKQKGVNTTLYNYDVVQNSKIIFIAVKPQYFEQAIKSIDASRKQIAETKIFVSIMAGKTISYIKKVIKREGPDTEWFDVIRVMPNTPCLVGKGCSVLCHDPDTLTLWVDEVKSLISCTGTCEIIPEHLFNAVAAVCGCGPAYIYIVIESLADGAVRCGVPRDLAMRIASQTVIGAGNIVKESGKHPGQLKDEVCSPGGTTIVGLHELEKAGIRSAFMNAVVEGTDRASLLSSYNPQ